MTRRRWRWKIAAIAGGAFVAVLVSGAVIANSWYRSTERTYYGPHSDLLRAGERVMLSQDFSAGHVVAKAQNGIVQEDGMKIRVTRIVRLRSRASGESISGPRYLLHR